METQSGSANAGAATEFDDEHFELFARYIGTRHAGGGMDPASPENYWSFVASRWCSTWLYEFRLDQELLAVAVVDRLDEGLSAVYTFFDPLHKARGLGTYAILWQIAEARQLGLPWVYLGYWIAQCDKWPTRSASTRTRSSSRNAGGG